MDWTSVFSATIALMCAILTAVVIPYLKNKIGDGKWAEIVRIVKVLVTAAEQIFQSTDGEKLGKDRLEWVLNQLTEYGIDINDEMLYAVIEAEVYKLNNAIEGK